MELLPSEDLQPAPPPGLAVGYMESPIVTPAGDARSMCVWLPLKGAADARLDAYTVHVDVCKKIRLVSCAAGLTLPRLACCAPMYTHTIPPSSSGVYGSTTANDLADASLLRGLILLAHGLADGPLVLAHLCESLARLGFVVAAPSFADSSCNDTPSVAELGRQFLAEAMAARLELMDACLSAMRSSYPAVGSLPLVLMGYSMGTDTVRQMSHVAATRVYLAGPGFLGKLAAKSGVPPMGPAPEGRSLHMVMSPDNTFALLGLSVAESAATTGYACPEARTIVDMERLGESSAFPAGVQHFHVLLAGCDHSGLKYVPFRASELAAYRSALCGVDPFNPSGKPPTSEWQQRKERAAAMGLDGIVRFLLATVRTIPAQAHAADNGSRSR